MEKKALALSITFSLLASYLVYQYLSKEEGNLIRMYQVQFPVVVATKDILQYQTIKPTDLDILMVPQSMMQPGTIAEPKDLIDSVASVPIAQGEMILDNKVISKNIYSGLDSQISFGKRAISIPVNIKTSVGFLIVPGNRVDLSTFFEYKQNGKAISEVKVFLQDILVLASGRVIEMDPPKAVDQDFARNISSKFNIKDSKEVSEILSHAKGDSNYQTLTLEVSPEQAQILVYVMGVFPDAINVMLRGNLDREVAREHTINLLSIMGENSFLGRPKKAAPPKAIPKSRFFDLKGGFQVPVFE